MRRVLMIGLSAMLAIFIMTVSLAQVNETTDGTNSTLNVTMNETQDDDGTNLTDEINDTDEDDNILSINQTNTTNTTTLNETSTNETTVNQTSGNVSVDLTIMRWYPKGPDYVFVCNATGFTPTTYTWFYGDGHKLLNILNQNTYHVYRATGQYTVSCSATDGVNTASDTLTINVDSLDRPVNPLFGTSRTFSCVSNQTNATATCTCANQNENSASCKCE